MDLSRRPHFIPKFAREKNLLVGGYNGSPTYRSKYKASEVSDGVWVFFWLFLIINHFPVILRFIRYSNVCMFITLIVDET